MRHAGSFVLTMLIAALPLYACAGSVETETNGTTPPDAGTTAQPPTAADVRTNVRDGFVAEAEWMRSYGVATLARAPEAPAAFDRLNASEAQIVAAISPVAGDARAAQLADLLHARANAFADLVRTIGAKAAPVGSDPQAALDANAQQIADFFVALCPNAFPSDAVNDLTSANRSMAEALQARAADDRWASISSFDAAQASSAHFADEVGFAIASTFGATLAPSTTSRTEDAVSLQLHVLFGDQVFWTRAYVADRMRNVEAQPELDRAVQATIDMTGVLSPYFGQDAVQMQAYIHADTTNAIAFVLALESGNQDTVQAISAQWNAGADTLAQYLAATARVDQAEAQRLLRVSVDREQAMIEARANEQWDAEAANYQLVLESRTELASLLASSTVVTTH